jgi:hypothetical protein
VPLGIHLCIGLPSAVFPPVFLTKILDGFLISPVRTVDLTQMTFLDLITCIMFDEENKLRKSSLCSYLQHSVTFCLLRPNIILGILFSNIFSLYFKIK